jgi:uncharacterized protein (DUF2249 family)
MTISSILIGLLLLGASLVFVSLPFQKKPRKGMNGAKAKVQTAERHEAVLSALRELDFDFKTGKVSEEDYTPLRAKLLTEAARYIDQEKNEDDKLEALIQSRRAAHQQGGKCEKCGVSLEADQSSCAKCGTSVNQESCPQCGKKVRAGDFFCTACGASLQVRKEAAVPS